MRSRRTSPWRCDAIGVAAHDDATSNATVSTAAFALGGAALATGVVLWVLAPRLDAQPRSDRAGAESRSRGLAIADGPGDVGLGLARSF